MDELVRYIEELRESYRGYEEHLRNLRDQEGITPVDALIAARIDEGIIVCNEVLRKVKEVTP